MPLKPYFLLLIAILLCSDPAAGQDIGVLGGEPPPAKTNKKTPTPKRPAPKRPTEKTPATRVKRRVTLTITTDPVECEVYLNDAYRGTTPTRNGKLAILDLDSSLSYTLRVYKRGVGENVQNIDLDDDLDLNITLTRAEKVDKPVDKTKEPENTDIAGNKPPTEKPEKREPDKPEINTPAAPDKPINKPPDNSVAVVKPPDKTPDTKPLNNNTTTEPVKPTPTAKPVSSEMVLIPAGEFQMGSKGIDNEKPIHKVFVPAFFIDVYEVTNTEYKLFCDATNRSYPNNPTWDKDYFLNKPNYPVVNVSWEDANAYAQWAGKRLPTEEEWEKAARSNENRIWPWGKEFQNSLANFVGKEDGHDFTAPVGNFRTGASTYGVFDLAGNVWEWTATTYKPYPNGPDIDKRYSENFRVIRGGGYNTPPLQFRGVTFRFPSEPNKSYEATGFRCARSQ